MAEPSLKLSPQARLLLSARSDLTEAGERVDLLIRVDASAVATARQRLEDSGASVRTEAGDVLTASAPVSALEGLAALGEVIAIDVATPLQSESPPTE